MWKTKPSNTLRFDMGIMRLIFALIVVVILVFVCLQNVHPDQTVTVVNVFQESFRDQPLGLILLVTAAVGMILAFLISLLSEIKLRRTIWTQRREIKKLVTEITALRNMPLAQGGEDRTGRGLTTAPGESQKGGPS
jgi:uncharacterized integral membrane protein